MDTATIKSSKTPWSQTEFLDQEETDSYLNGVGGSRTGVYGETTVELACELESVPPGTSKRFKFDSKEQAVQIQGYIREACYLAGWYKDIPDNERDDWVMWESHSHPGNEFGIPPHLTITHLAKKRQSRSVTMRHNRIKKLQAEGTYKP